MKTLEMNTVTVGKYVDTAHVQNITNNYKKERWIQNSEKIGKEDSLSVWWSVAELEQFLQNAKTHGADGVKFYFGAYDKDHAPCAEYEDRQTLVMVGTKKKQTGSGVKNKDIYFNTDKGSSILAYNMGQMCPPFCGQDNTVDPDGGSIYID